MEKKEYFGDYKSNNIVQLEQYMNYLDKMLKDVYNFENPFFKGDYKIEYYSF